MVILIGKIMNDIIVVVLSRLEIVALLLYCSGVFWNLVEDDDESERYLMGR